MTSHKLLIANRGEIAMRIISSCKDLGISTVALAQKSEIDAPFAQAADTCLVFEGQSLQESYLNTEEILKMAKKAGASMLHPGYGFLSENADFAQAVNDAGIIFLGPSPLCMRILGDKISARALAQRLNLPLAKGSNGVLKDDELFILARELGFPLAIKAAAGGGGRGLRVVRDIDSLEAMYKEAKREAKAAFGNDDCFMEQYLEEPRHIEVQVLGDLHGNIKILGTRDCSLQRRNQKLVEEAPAPFLAPSEIELIKDAAYKICKELNYHSAGTVEFLRSKTGLISFLEVNTRLQVEHPVSEEAGGFDLVAWQIKVALGHKLDIDTNTKAHAIEFRIVAEDPAMGFLPSSGLITSFNPPSGLGIRLDSGVITGSKVLANFDGLIAKLIVKGKDRPEAIARAKRAISQFQIQGLATTLPLFKALLEQEDFISQKELRINTRWLDSKDLKTELNLARQPNLGSSQSYFSTSIELDGRVVKLTLPEVLAPKQELEQEAEESELKAPLSGTLISWQVAEGDSVKLDQVVAIMSAMKTEFTLHAHKEGRIRMLVEPSSSIEDGRALALIE